MPICIQMRANHAGHFKKTGKHAVDLRIDGTSLDRVDWKKGVDDAPKGITCYSGIV